MIRAHGSARFDDGKPRYLRNFGAGLANCILRIRWVAGLGGFDGLRGAIMINKLYAFVLALAGVSFGSYIVIHEVSESVRGDSGMLESSAARRSEC